MAFEDGTILRVSMKAVHGIDGDSQVNTFHYDAVDNLGGENTDGQKLADHFRDQVMPAMQVLYTPQWTIEPVIVMEERDPLNQFLPRREWQGGLQLVGTRTTAADLLPRAVCVVVTLRTASVGRRRTGRTFVGSSFDESDQSTGQWATGTGHWNSILAYMGAIPPSVPVGEGGATVTANWVIYSRTQRAQNLGNYTTPVTTWAPRTQVHWLRSRMS
jgi:hypothetical protein